MQKADLRSEAENCCRFWGLKHSDMSMFVYYNFAISGAGLDIDNESVVCSNSRLNADQLSFTVFTCCSSSP